MKIHLQEDILSAYLDGMLDVASMHEVGSHLQTCSECRRIFSDFQQNRNQLRSAVVPVVSPEFWTNTYRRLRVELEAQPVIAPPVWRTALETLFSGTQRRLAAGTIGMAVLTVLAVSPIWHTPNVHINPVSNVIGPPAVEDFNTDDVMSVVQAHAQSVAAQPIADQGRQAVLTTDVVNNPGSNDPSAEATVDVDYSL